MLLFKAKSSNKTCRATFLENNKTGLAIFGFFYKFLRIFDVRFEIWGGGTGIFALRPLEVLKSKQLGPSVMARGRGYPVGRILVSMLAGADG